MAFFILGKLFTVMLHPLFWLICLLFYWAITKKQVNKYKIYFLAVLAFVSSNKVFVNHLALGLENNVTKPNISLKKAIVLGGYGNWHAKTNEIQFNAAAERLFLAINLFKTKQIDTIVLSGGSIGKSSISEALLAKNYLIKNQISATNILIDETSLSTYQNAINCKKLVSTNNQFYLITSAWHMQRAIATFKKQQLKPIAYPVNYISVSGSSFTVTDYFLPSAQALLNFELVIKEYVGIIAYKLSSKL